MSAAPLGFLQLCADRRFHHAVMDAFERETQLRSDEYWIEARAGGAPSWGDNTKTCRYAHDHGARFMGWSAHGASCGGFPGDSDETMLARLRTVAARRAEEFPDSVHFALFALPGGVDVTRVGRR